MYSWRGKVELMKPRMGADMSKGTAPQRGWAHELEAMLGSPEQRRAQEAEDLAFQQAEHRRREVFEAIALAALLLSVFGLFI